MQNAPTPKNTGNPTELFRDATDHHQRGRLREAIAAYDRVIALQPDHIAAHHNRAGALHQLGRFDEALVGCDRIVALKPHDIDAHRNRCHVLSRLGRYDEALAGCDRIIALAPNAFSHDHRGDILDKLGRYEEALASYERAIALNPDYVTAHYNRGTVLNKLGRHNDALTSFDRAIVLNPEYVWAHYNRGNGLRRLGRYGEALASYRRAIALKPDYVEAHYNCGNVLRKLGRYDEALTCYQRAIALKPDYVDAHNNLGNTLRNFGRYEEALAAYKRATALQPQYAYAQFGKAVLQLAFGDYEHGLENYEWRWRSLQKPREFTQPLWRGESIAGKTILLHAEQGLGDSIQMLRYLPLVKEKGARVVLVIPETIQPLLGPMAESVVVAKFDLPLPPFDVHCPLMSLPLAFGTRVDTIPAQVPYLIMPAERIPTWRVRLPKSARPRIGLAWSGSAGQMDDHNRSMALDQLAPLLKVAGVSFVSLQREYRDKDLPALSHLPIERIDDALADLGDTAAAIEQCDLVISVCTSVAHLAGSLGKPLWVLLSHAADWRWLLDRTDSPWYPSAPLFRQTKIGDWEGVVEAVVNELSALLEGLANTGKMRPVGDGASTGPQPDR